MKATNVHNRKQMILHRHKCKFSIEVKHQIWCFMETPSGHRASCAAGRPASERDGSKASDAACGLQQRQRRRRGELIRARCSQMMCLPVPFANDTNGIKMYSVDARKSLPSFSYQYSGSSRAIQCDSGVSWQVEMDFPMTLMNKVFLLF